MHQKTETQNYSSRLIKLFTENVKVFEKGRKEMVCGLTLPLLEINLPARKKNDSV